MVADESVTLTIYATLADQSAEAKDVLMTLAERLEARGEARGEARAKIDAVLEVLEVRGIPVSPEQRARIRACTELALLDRWLRTAVTASSTSELFASSS